MHIAVYHKYNILTNFHINPCKGALKPINDGSIDARDIQHTARGHDRMDRWRTQITGG